VEFYVVRQSVFRVHSIQYISVDRLPFKFWLLCFVAILKCWYTAMSDRTASGKMNMTKVLKESRLRVID